MSIPIEVIEKELLRQVKFVDVVLQEIRDRNEELRNRLGTSYAKFVGVIAPYDCVVRELRETKSNFDSYLKAARENMASEYRKRYHKGYAFRPKESRNGPGSPRGFSRT